MAATSSDAERIRACESILAETRPIIKKRFDACLEDLDGRTIIWSCPQCGRQKPPFPLERYHLFEMECAIGAAKSLNPPPKVEVRASLKYGGSGVFATAPIKKGEVITYYPAHTLLVCQDTGEMISLDVVGSFDAKPKSEADNMLDYYLLTACSLKFVGDPTLGREYGAFCGHLINDSVDLAVLQPLVDALIENPSEENALKYATCVNSFPSNADFVGCLSGVTPGVPILALRDIEVDEEITAPYGPGYWLTWRRRQLFPDEKDHDKTIAFTNLVEKMLIKYRTKPLV